MLFAELQHLKGFVSSLICASEVLQHDECRGGMMRKFHVVIIVAQTIAINDIIVIILKIFLKKLKIQK